MARWFDDAAKAAARRELAAATPPKGVTRRTALKRGAVIAGVAWTAPVLMQTRAYAGASMCATGTTPCFGTSPSTAVACCATGQVCNTNATTGVPTCAAPNDPGGVCGNQGVGECTSTSSVKSNCNGKLDQCNGCRTQYICGGEAAPCNSVDLCAPGLTCTSAGGATGSGSHCRKKCTSSAGCNTGQVCDTNGFCAQDCGPAPAGTGGKCQGAQSCVTNGTNQICNYDQK